MESPQLITDEGNDLKIALKNTRDLIDKTQVVAISALAVAEATQDPKSFTAAAAMIRAATDLNRNLAELKKVTTSEGVINNNLIVSGGQFINMMRRAGFDSKTLGFEETIEATDPEEVSHPSA